MFISFWFMNFMVFRFAKCDDAMENLYRSLLTDYNKDIRPSIRHNIPVDVDFSMTPIHLADLDERNQILTLNAWIHLSWRDWRLSWDPREHKMITDIKIPYSTVWIPDIVLYNNAASEYLDSIVRTDIILNYQGNISFSMTGIFKSSCELDVRLYPFDNQNCVLKFASWAYDGTKIDMTLSSDLSNQANYQLYQVSTEWHLKSIKAMKNSIVYSCCPEPYPFIDVILVIERKSMFFVLNLIIPCVLISLLVLLGFYMPSDSGEKVTLGITSLLSTTVFLMLVAEQMPPTADTLPLIGVYYGVTIFIVSIETALTVFTLNINHTGLHGKPVPYILQYLLFGRVARFLLLGDGYEQFHSTKDHVDYFFNKSQIESDKTPSISIISRRSLISPKTSLPTQSKESSRPNSVQWKPELIVSFDEGNIRKNELSNSLSQDSSASEQQFLSTPTPYHAQNGGCIKQNHQPKQNSHQQQNHNQPILKKARDKTNVIKLDSVSSENEFKSAFEVDFLKVLQKLNMIVERNEVRLSEKDRMNAMKLEWKMCALVLDRFFLTFFVLVMALMTYLIIFQNQKM